MSQVLIFIFIAIMWVLILAGGGILVTMVSKISITGYGQHLDFFLASIVKAIIAIALVGAWILVLTKLKNKIFQKQIKA